MSESDLDDFIHDIAAELKRPVHVDAGFDSRVMAALAAPRAAVLPFRRRVASSWLFRPHSFAISPFGALAAAAGLAGIMVAGLWHRDTAGVQQVAANPPATPVAAPPSAPVAPAAIQVSAVTPTRLASQPVPFIYAAPNARSVAVVGDFNDWDATRTPLVRGPDGIWTTTLLLTPAVHEYQFVVDGERWVNDPRALKAPRNAFGSANSIVTVRGVSVP